MSTSCIIGCWKPADALRSGRRESLSTERKHIMLDLHSINARDRRDAAIHEAAHIVISEHFGINVVRAAIWPSPRQDALLERTWSGQIKFIAGSECRPEVWRAIGIAGVVAEDLWFEREEDAVEGHYWDFRVDTADAMSASDWHLCRAKPEVDADALCEAATKVAELLRGALWGKLIETARQLIVEARIATSPTTEVPKIAGCTLT